jgi:Ran GTPase-activating protein (RanGAP) involved in mRNA processing and transport
VALRARCEARPTEAGGDCRLNLGSENIGDGGAAALGRALASLPRPLPYTATDLRDNGLGPAGVRSVARGLRLGYGGGGGGRGLEVLWLNYNPFGGDAEAVGALAAALPPTLKMLGLAAVGLGDAGLGALLPFLRALPVLEVLQLDSNELGAEGFRAVGAALPSWAALRELWLQYNRRAGSEGVRALAAALPGAPPSLAALDAEDCGADAATEAELKAVLRQRLPGTVLAAARLGQADQEMPAGTRVTVDGYGPGTVVEGFVKSWLVANEHAIRFDGSPPGSPPGGVTKLQLRKHWWAVAGELPALLSRGDAAAFWARVGEGCGVFAAAALAAVRAACAARPTEAGGDCELDLHFAEIGDGGAAALGRALASLPRPLPYTGIDLRDNGLGPAGVRSVARGLRLGYGGGGGGRGLEVLDLYANPFGGDAEAVGALAAALPPTLKDLNLTGVGLGNAGLGALLPSLRALPTLEVLSLCSNELGAEGFGAVGAALPSWAALRELRLQYNRRAGSAGVRALAAALSGAPPSLAALEVMDCGADAAAVAELERAGARIEELWAQWSTNQWD